MVTRAPSSRSRIPPQELLRRAASVRLVLLDVEGVLTDGRAWYGPGGGELLALDAKDLLGLALLRGSVELGVLSCRPARAVRARFVELKVRHLLLGERDKLAGFARLEGLGFAAGDVAYMGDDVDDLPVLERVALSACPGDARPEVKERVHFRASAPGGQGAVRELCDLVLKARGAG